ncbi:GGDEF domain-containing protein [Kineococcus sp. G2]|uniref:GGDEF domain-containing protein n=1 Tax=Kineococcus sp. G2 TaxID=3127484 RepID=UPI00301CAA0A
MRPAPRWRAPLRSLSARDTASARVWASVALMATIGTCLGTTALTTGSLRWPELVVTALLGAVSAALLLLPVHRAEPLVVLAPLAGTGTVVWLDVLSADAGVSGQVFFCVPVIWAASQLRLGGAALVTAVTVAAEAFVVLTLLPRERALADLAYVTTLLLLVAGVLAHGAVTQERLVQRLRHQADVDPLTGLVTRRVLDAAAERAVGAPGAGAALVVVDVDRFKAVNDTHGHLGGDAALAHVAAVLTARCRPEDVVARMGGDELAVLMPGCPEEVAAQRAQALVEAVRERPLVLPGGVRVPLSVSAGLACAPRHAVSARDLYAGADSALYAAKRAGRDRLGRVPGA